MKTFFKIAGGIAAFIAVAIVMVVCAYISVYGFNSPCGSHSPIC